MPYGFFNRVPFYFAKSARLSLSAALLWLVTAPFAIAQNAVLESSNGAISGTVLLSAENRPASQVVVTLKSRLLGVSRSVLTDFDGRFNVQGLPAGAYEVSAEESGFEPAVSKVSLESNLSGVVLRLKQAIPGHPLRTSPTVSVRQLKTPAKAQDEYQRGLQNLEKNELQEALKHFMKAAATYPDFYEAEYHAGLAHLRMGHNREAMQFFQQVVDKSDGRYAPAQFGVGALLFDSGSIEEAEKIIRRGLESDDTFAEGYALLGMIQIRQHKLEEAEKSAREALLRKSTFAQAYLVLADVHAGRKEFRSQLEDLETYLTLQADGPDRKRVIQAREIVLRNIARSELLVANASN